MSETTQLPDGAIVGAEVDRQSKVDLSRAMVAIPKEADPIYAELIWREAIAGVKGPEQSVMGGFKTAAELGTTLAIKFSNPDAVIGTALELAGGLAKAPQFFKELTDMFRSAGSPFGERSSKSRSSGIHK